MAAVSLTIAAASAGSYDVSAPKYQSRWLMMLDFFYNHTLLYDRHVFSPPKISLSPYDQHAADICHAVDDYFVADNRLLIVIVYPPTGRLGQWLVVVAVHATKPMITTLLTKMTTPPTTYLPG
jgi:hypothetical protein